MPSPAKGGSFYYRAIVKFSKAPKTPLSFPAGEGAAVPHVNNALAHHHLPCGHPLAKGGVVLHQQHGGGAV